MIFNITRPTRLFMTLLLFGAIFAVDPAFPGTVTLTLDDVNVSACEEVWQEAGLSLWFTETTAEDLTPGFCFIVADANNLGQEGVYIWPARLVLDLSDVQGLESLEVDIYETHFAGSTRARMYADGQQISYAASYAEDHQTLVLPAAGADTFVISAHEAYVWQIRLIGDALVPNRTTSLGALKRTFR